MSLCEVCGCEAVDIHHRIFRSKVPALKKCKLNLVPLCRSCHTKIHHGKGKDIDLQLKLEFQNKLEFLFDKELLSVEEINQVLEISENALIRLLKTVPKVKDKYIREEVIKKCCGGRLYTEGDINKWK